MKKVLIITYYWPPSGGSGVQRWLYFAKYLPASGIQPFVVTVDPAKASYKFLDASLSEKVKNTPVFHTSTLEPLQLYSKVLSGDKSTGIPQGFAGEAEPGFFQKISRWVRGNFFIPDARIGWNRYAYKKAKEIIQAEGIQLVITTGPPHSTHLVGRKLKKKLGVKWIADFRDPWTEVYYNKLLYRTALADRIDKYLERSVLNSCDLVLTMGPSMKALLEKKITSSVPVEYVYNGFDSEVIKDLVANRSDRLTITHIGILGESQPITSFLRALSQLFREEPSIQEELKLQLIGRVSEVIIKEVKEITPWLLLEVKTYVPHKEALQYMKNSDILFNSLAEMDNSELLISGKLMEYLASGNPVICLGSETGDAAKLLKDFQSCAVYSRSNIEGIKFYLSKQISSWRKGSLNVRPYESVQQYSRENTSKSLGGILSKLI